MNVSCVCGYCRRVVDYGEGIFDDEVWFHKRCYFTKLKKEVASLEKKARNKSITLEEYEYLQEILPILNNIRSCVREPSIKLSNILLAPTTPVFEGKSEGMLKIREHIALLADNSYKDKQLTAHKLQD